MRQDDHGTVLDRERLHDQEVEGALVLELQLQVLHLLLSLLIKNCFSSIETGRSTNTFC